MKTVPDKQTIHPVVLPVPAEARLLSGKRKVLCLSRLAREALSISARLSGIPPGELKLEKDQNGAPLPWAGYFWSLSHKPEYACGVVAREEIGIDIEKIKPCSPSLFKKTACEREWDLFGDEELFHRFFRCWTSKEAVIKAAGTGIKDLLKCCVIETIDDRHLSIFFQGKKWPIEHFFFDGHISSVVQTARNVEWTVLKGEARKRKRCRISKSVNCNVVNLENQLKDQGIGRKEEV